MEELSRQPSCGGDYSIRRYEELQPARAVLPNELLILHLMPCFRKRLLGRFGGGGGVHEKLRRVFIA